MADYYVIPTNIGEAKMANALALGIPLEITELALGDGEGTGARGTPLPDPERNALVSERRRAPINSFAPDPDNGNVLIAEQVVPETVGGFWIREMGLFDADGDMIFVCNTPPTYKPQLSEGSGRTQVVRMAAIVSDAAAVTLKVDPSVVLATREYAQTLMTEHEKSRNHPAATESDQGMARYATVEQTVSGQSVSLATHPHGVKAAILKAAIEQASVERVAKNHHVLRRAVNSLQHYPARRCRGWAYSVLESSKKTTTDESNIIVWEPDGEGFYSAAWIRDMAMAMEGHLSYFSGGEIADVFNWILGKSNLVTGEVPDHIGLDGTVYWTPGNANTWGSRAPVDGNTYLVQMAWLHYVITGSASLYAANAAALTALIDTGIPYGESGCVNIPDADPFVGFGFYDTAILTGDVLFPSILAYRAYQQLAEMACSTGNYTETNRLLDRAAEIRTGINTSLFNYYDMNATSPAVRDLGFFKAATIKGAGQLDIWGTSYALYCDVVDEGKARLAALNLVGQMSSDAAQSNVISGGVRHVIKGTDFSATAVWEAYFSAAPTYGTYQNGGFWPTALPWFCHGVSLVDPGRARSSYAELVTYFYNAGGTPRLYEWWNEDKSAFGAGEYKTSAVATKILGDVPYVADIAGVPEA